jgi:hypothetical protein
MMAYLGASKATNDRMMLDQFESPVQPTQFFEYLRQNMPMTEAQLDMLTSTHKLMVRRLNAAGGAEAMESSTP